jgi:probable phosphoglycerate mutase
MSSLFASPSAAPDFIHAHCDGGSRGNPGPSGFGAIITDAQGETLAELSEFLGVRTNNYAEYSGLLAVLRWALQNGRTRLKLVSDSELMVKQIQGKYKVNSPDLKPLWQQARDMIQKFDDFQISHALRHKNKEADALANQAMDRGTRQGGGAAPELIRTSAVAPRTGAAAPRTGAASAAPAQSAPAKSASAKHEVRAPGAHPSAAPTMLRGFVKNGQVQLLGGHSLPDGIFVKVIRE